MQFPYYYTPVAGNYSPAERDEMFGMIRNADTPGNLASYNGVLALAPRPNLLDNAYFVGEGSGYGVFPVNQRGQTQYSTAGNIFDRWIIGSGNTISLESDGLALSGGIAQYMEVNRVKSGKTYTLSALLTDGTLWTATGEPVASTSWQLLSGTANSNGIAIRQTGGKWQVAIWNNVATRKAIAAKLEIGSIQTLTHQESGTWVLNEIPRYDEELRRCQAYLVKYNIAGDFLSDSGGNIAATFGLPVTLAANPSSITYDNVAFYDGSWKNTPIGTTRSSQSMFGFITAGTGANALTPNKIIYCQGTALISAELQ